MKYIDLHFHSYYSDGQLSPQAILQKAKQAGNYIVSLTDHNGISGIESAAQTARKLKMKLITGIEFYCVYKTKRIHILGYNFNLDHPALGKIIEGAQAKHRQRVVNILAKAEKMGFIIDHKKINKAKSVYLGWDVIVETIRSNRRNQKKINKDLGNQTDLLAVIGHYFSYGKPGFVKPVDWPAPKFIEAVKKAGGVAILAHPGQQLRWKEDYLILELKKHGISGIEVFTPYHNWHQMIHYQRLAYDHKLITTGGTDYHGDILDKKLQLKKQWDYFSIPDKIYKNGLGKLINKIK